MGTDNLIDIKDKHKYSYMPCAINLQSPWLLVAVNEKVQ